MIPIFLTVILLLQIITLFFIYEESTKWIDKLTPEQLIFLWYKTGLISSEEQRELLERLHEKRVLEQG